MSKRIAGKTYIIQNSSDAIGNQQGIGIGRGKLRGIVEPSNLAKLPSYADVTKRGKKPRVAKLGDPKQPLRFLEGASFFSVGGAMLVESGGSVGKTGIAKPPLIKKRLLPVAEPPRSQPKIPSGTVPLVQISQKRKVKKKQKFETKDLISKIKKSESSHNSAHN